MTQPTCPTWLYLWLLSWSVGFMSLVLEFGDPCLCVVRAHGLTSLFSSLRSYPPLPCWLEGYFPSQLGSGVGGVLLTLTTTTFPEIRPLLSALSPVTQWGHKRSGKHLWDSCKAVFTDVPVTPPSFSLHLWDGLARSAFPYLSKCLVSAFILKFFAEMETKIFSKVLFKSIEM